MRHLPRRLSLGAVLSAGLLAAGTAQAYEYPLQFSVTGNYEGLVVAGYQISGSTVVGNCSYTRITSGSGRDPRTYYTPVPETCTWNLYGSLLSIASGAPTIPAPAGTSGTETIYALQSANEYTGTDSALSTGGFVFTYGSHYNWLTSNAYTVLNTQGSYTFTVSLTSNGDAPLTITAVKASAAMKQSKVTVSGNTCIGQIPAGGTCGMTITYNDAKLSSTTGLAYDTLTIHLTSNAGVASDFVQSYTDVVRIPPD